MSKNKDTFKQKWLHKFRLVILNEDTFEEHFSFKLTRLNVFVFGMLLAIVLITLTTFLIAFTPIREYIPGYSSTALKKKATVLTNQADSIEHKMRLDSIYYQSIKNVLKGDVKSIQINKDSIVKAAQDIEALDLNPIKEDSLLREKVEKEDKYNLFETTPSNLDFVLFPPAKGTISQVFNAKEKHYAVDVIVVKDTPIKAVADGTVIFSEWTVDTGYVIILKHSNNLISVYKHNASLTKKQGDLVKTGEVIATAGNTGELSTGPHLHFELWRDGYALDPTNFIDFK